MPWCVPIFYLSPHPGCQTQLVPTLRDAFLPNCDFLRDTFYKETTEKNSKDNNNLVITQTIIITIFAMAFGNILFTAQKESVLSTNTENVL